MNFYFVNHNKKKIALSDYPYLFQSGDLLDYNWDYETITGGKNKLKSLKKSPKEFFVKIAVLEEFGIPLEQRREKFKASVDYLVQVFEEDVLDGVEGRLYTETGYYLSCMCIGSKKADWNMGLPVMFNELTILSLNPMWLKDTTYVFRTDISVPSAGEERNLDYPYDFPCDFVSGMTERTIQNTGVAPVDFEITLYGACLNPTVNIGGQTYRVYATIEKGEYLKINSINKKIYKVKVNGEVVNLFHQREREYTPFFRKIKPGLNAVTWSGAYGIDVTLFEERSEPKWT